MSHSKRKTLAALCGALSLALLGAASPALAQDGWPSKPIRMVVPFAPGGSNDVIARRLALQLTKNLGQSVVIDNRAGGGSTIGANVVATSPADGYTLLFVSGSLATTAAVQKTPYDLVKAFEPVSRVAIAPFVILTREGFPAKTVQELIAYAKANPGKINYGSAGLGDSTQLATELFSNAAGIKMTAVGYKGISPAQMDLIAGRIDLVITTVASIRGTAAESLPKIAFTTIKRDPEFPNVPTVRESGLDYVVDVWWGVFAPAGTHAAIRDRLNREIATIVAEPEFASFLKTAGAGPAPSTPQLLRDEVAKDVARWTDTARRAGIQQQ
ncbi:Bug family tripartite tricarboxylate transporter substrate binding protein [Variovorax terrae]|uniref:Tripartite tricarboxylate transporter substrate binding protein n=1 Tax=Variovorax terrae TaxID=2923278 RepID=A0A9X1VX71_9BURK|nr:tripartite tricarboxylate transporter substrate binding protein [Variovorax terrae]MCJ0762188.1 tripartite tricarboxylate transporter substrate binding protein [Variovorax terrae]